MTTMFQRYVALGDSQTEGLNDGDEATGLLGWADRLADHLAEQSPDLTYANLAIRGCRARHVRAEQLPAALALKPDLASVVVGMNDMLRHDFDLDETVQQVEETVVALQAEGAHVVSMTFPDIDTMHPVMAWLAPRQRALNARIRDLAVRRGVPLLEVSGLPLTADRRMWSDDRLHGSTLGHTRIAAGMARLMELPGSDDTWRDALSPAPDAVWRTAAREVHWLATFVAPWLTRQLLGRSTGDGRAPKRPDLLPVRTGTTTAAPPG